MPKFRGGHLVSLGVCISMDKDAVVAEVRMVHRGKGNDTICTERVRLLLEFSHVHIKAALTSLSARLLLRRLIFTGHVKGCLRSRSRRCVAANSFRDVKTSELYLSLEKKQTLVFKHSVSDMFFKRNDLECIEQRAPDSVSPEMGWETL